MPTLNGNGDYDVEVVGESHYQDALVRAAGPHTEEGRRVEVPAMLYLEPKNPNDPNAIRVEINKATVGYIPRDMAAEIRIALKEIGIKGGQRVGVDAMIIGGRIGQSYGVWLDIDLGEAFYEAEWEEDDEDDEPAPAIKTVKPGASVPSIPTAAPSTAQPAAMLAAVLLVLVALLAVGMTLAYMLR